MIMSSIIEQLTIMISQIILIGNQEWNFRVFDESRSYSLELSSLKCSSQNTYRRFNRRFKKRNYRSFDSDLARHKGGKCFPLFSNLKITKRHKMKLSNSHHELEHCAPFSVSPTKSITVVPQTPLLHSWVSCPSFYRVFVTGSWWRWIFVEVLLASPLYPW